VALTDSARMRPILDGRVGVEGVKLAPRMLSAGELIWRQLRLAEFDVSEMSIASYIISISHGTSSWVGLPVFANRSFPHTGVVVRSDSGIAAPADLRGKRVGIVEYQQSSVVWIRGVLQHEFGVAPHEIQWCVERSPSASHGAATGFRPPPGVQLSFVPFDSSLSEMMLADKLDAIAYYPDDPFDRRHVALGAKCHPLFADPAGEGRRYYEKTGFFPVNHCVIVRRELAESHPEVLTKLYNAFVEAKDLAQVPELYPSPYGIEAAASLLETYSDYLVEQGLSSRPVHPDEMFVH
jgi:4,5-dihydroxyphthalate decarboxylase